jgi:AcrR family transcriptional regulator
VFIGEDLAFLFGGRPHLKYECFVRFSIRIPIRPMPRRKRPQISSRKQPQQARSGELVRAILEAAVQVLAKEGAARFTTARVAAKAGVSVGSIYQYFPNKASILFRLQSDEWRETTALMRRILQGAGSPPLDRLRTLVHAFLKSECDEASLRVALDDAAPLYRNAPETAAAMADWDSITETFMREALPGRPKALRDLVGDMIGTTLSAYGKDFSETPRTPAEIKTHADAMADMFCAYLKSL